MREPDGGASPDVKRRLRRIVSYGWVLILAMITLSFVPSDAEPWGWVKLAALAVGTTVFLIGVTRFSLWQRDEYWRERGKDPKHPERLPNHPLE